VRTQHLRPVAPKGQPAGQHLVGQHTERVDVGGGADRRTRDLLRRGRIRGTQARIIRREARASQRQGDAEVHQLDRPARRDHDVRRLDIAVHEPRLVQIVHGRAERVDDLQHACEGEAPAIGEQLLQRLPVHDLHREVRSPAGVADVEDGDEVGMTQRGQRARFGKEPLAVVGVAGERGVERLQRDMAAKQGIVRPKDVGKAARAEPATKLVAAKTRGWLRVHARRSLSCGGSKHMLP
jgi:hypothetical protein